MDTKKLSDLLEPKPEPVPPENHVKQAGHHWLEIFDMDGHSFGLVVMQWQPGAKKWCHSGYIGSGHDIDTRGWRYVEAIPLPKI